MAEVKPAISVLIPAYNAAATIGVAIQSILNQSFGDFELLVCNDGSSDGTAACLEAINDKRLKLINHAFNRGVAASRNTLLKAAQGRYVAWLDADDIALPGRLEKQYAYLEENPNVDMLFGWIKVRNAAVRQVRFPADDALLAVWLLFRNPYAQSTLMARNFFAAESVWYDETIDYSSWQTSEDYNLYQRLSDKCFHMLPELLCSYWAPNEKRYAMAPYGSPEAMRLLEINLGKLGVSCGESERQAFAAFLRNNLCLNAAEARAILDVLYQLERAVWPEKAAPAAPVWLAMQWLRTFRLAPFKIKIRCTGKLICLGPANCFKAWRLRVRYL